MQIALLEHGTLYETRCNWNTENIISGVISWGSGTCRIQKQQARLRIRAVSPVPPLFAHTRG